MIAYFDTSALIPLLVEEPTSATAGRLWDEAHRVGSVRLIYAEARAALAMAVRVGRLDRRELDRVVGELDRIYAQLDRIEIDDHLVRRAGVLAQEHGLRGYDAVHLAAAERVTAPDVVFVAGDRDLCLAAESLSLNVAPLT